MLKVNYEGQEYEFVGYCDHEGATHFLSGQGTLEQTEPHNRFDVAWFRLVPVRHTFGGIVFEETGEVRQVEQGEWYLSREPVNEPVCHKDQNKTYRKYSILRPVEVLYVD